MVRGLGAFVGRIGRSLMGIVYFTLAATIAQACPGAPRARPRQY
jgi:hypothetical protein